MIAVDTKDSGYLVHACFFRGGAGGYAILGIGVLDIGNAAVFRVGCFQLMGLPILWRRSAFKGNARNIGLQNLSCIPAGVQTVILRIWPYQA